MKYINNSKSNRGRKIVANFLTDEDGATAIEYGLIAALISVAIIAAVSLLGESLNDVFQSIADTLNA